MARSSPFVGEMCSYAMDVWLSEADLLTDEAGLLELLRGAAAAGGAQVLGETSAVFPNGAVTAVLLLSQSHLSVHTWPEYRMANFDLLTCGRLNGERMLGYLKAELAPERANVVRVIRDVD
jgi:S-adenosylmethionine decarboxylase